MTDSEGSLQSSSVGEQDFRRVFDEHLSYVWHSLRRLGVREADLRDQAQEVFLVVHRLLPTYDPARPMRPWLFAIAFRVASAYRSRERYRKTEALDSEPAGTTLDPEAELEAHERRELFIQALERVDFSRRPVFILAEIEGHTMPEIAESLDIPLNTAYSRLRLARDEFRAAAERLAKIRGSAP